MNLLGALPRERASAAALVTPSGGTWSFEQLAGAPGQPPLQAAARHDAVAVRFRDPLKLIVALAGLDGRVQRLLLLAHDAPADVALGLVAAGGATLLLTDGAPLGEMETIRWDAPAEPVAAAAPSSPVHETLWMLATSGTTSTPKLVAHTLASLCRTSNRREGAQDLRWGQMYDVNRFAGAQVLLQSLTSGATLILPEPAWSLPERLAFLAEHGSTAVSATPTLWRKILMSPESADLPLRQITLGGEIADQAILNALADRYPDARITHVYASTEAGAAFSVTDRRAGFPARYLGEPPKGVELKIRDGRLWVKTDRANAAYVGTDAAFSDAEGFVDTGDAVEVRGDRCHFLGRANGVINVGGNKLFPEEVERVLLEHGAVRMARVSAKKSPITGQLVAAEVVLADGHQDKAEISAQLLAHCRARLEAWKTPALLRLVSDLAPNAGGKLSRAAL